jgi:hypothetical protein
MLQDSERSFWKSTRQLTVLSLLRDLQPLIIQYIQQHMALTLDITKDYYYQQGEKVARNVAKSGDSRKQPWKC